MNIHTLSFFLLNIWSSLCIFCRATFDGHMARWLSSRRPFRQILSLPLPSPTLCSGRLTHMGSIREDWREGAREEKALGEFFSRLCSRGAACLAAAVIQPQLHQ